MEEREKSAERENPDIVKIVEDWGISNNGISRLLMCGIRGREHLEALDDATISKIFCDDTYLGDCVVFRTKLRQWRLCNGTEDLANPENVVPPHQVPNPMHISADSNAMVGNCKACPLKCGSLKDLLKSSLKGEALLNNYVKHNMLRNCDQNDLVSIIIDNHLRFDLKRDR
ncbi:uncharacterized protein LOC129801286 [Phlebotomus papatasi]|uniref:uncharacterized protein LOC129801286 n=1 Tax=Phlebotomus papatasi TaxID=29031 RepID=UPI002483823D|nr:uncharacterized protein LOC129801286 [Phlebotomus papatasi]